MLENVWLTWLELAPWLLLGAAVSGGLHVWLPAGFVERQLRGAWGVVKATLFGVPLPLCSCGVIPAGLGLKRDGASDGATVAFLISTPQTGVDSVLVSAGMLGWPFAMFKVGAALVTGVAGGLLVEGFGGPTQALGDPALARDDTAQPVWRRAWEHADDVVGSVWGWLVAGVVVSAALQTWVPAAELQHTPVGQGVLAGLFMLVISLPLYVCATASVPIAAGLLHAGLPPSAALVFLMAGPATNVATVGAVYRAFGARVLGLYLGTVALGSLGLGVVCDAVLVGAVAAGGAHEHAGALSIAAGLALLAWMAPHAWAEAQRWLAPLRRQEDAPVLQLEVGGMTCGGCAGKVERVVRGLSGVTDVSVELASGLVTVSGRVEATRVRDTIREAGFHPQT